MSLRKRQAFSREMDSYLSSRNKRRFKLEIPSIFKKKAQDETVPILNEDRSVTVEPELKKEGFFSRLFKRNRDEEDIMMQEMEYVQQVESPADVEMPRDVHYEKLEEPETEKKQGFFSKIFGNKDEVMIFDSKEDMKELGRSVVGLLEKISPEERMKLKDTYEFDNLKNILKKHELIK